MTDFTGDGGPNTITGTADSDTIFGLGGSDILNGAGGNDLIIGGDGGDTLTGGTGADTFRGTASESNGDRITDFLIGDRIQISDLTVANANISIQGSSLVYNGGSIQIDNLGPGRLVLRSVNSGGIEIRLQSAAHNDFNGDGISDILWRNDNGALTDWLGKSDGGFTANASNLLTVVDNPWQVAGTGDFNGDGRVDVMWRRSDGALTDWLGKADGGLTPNAANLLDVVDTQWKIVGTGDFNGDGRADVMWHRTDGAITNWLGTASGGLAPNAANLLDVVDTAWSIAGVGDFNGDGYSDVLWHRTDGAVTNWLGNASGGLTPNAANLLEVVDTAWSIAGVGDFNGDGRDDVLWHRTDGALTDWLGTASGGLTPNSANLLRVVSTDWQVVATGDYNGDAIDDVLWRNTDGRLTDWLGTNTGSLTDNSAHAQTSIDTHWHVQPAELLF